jgi:hypothetical protein
MQYLQPLRNNNKFATLQIFVAAFLFVCSIALGGQVFSKPKVAGSVALSCSGTCWADVHCSDPSACDTTSTAQTINGSGTIKFSGFSGFTVQYSDNGGTFTGVANNGTISWTSGHTLAIKIVGLPQGCPGGNSATVTVSDNSNSTTLGTFNGTNDAFC